MRISFIWPGKTKDARLRALVQEYLERLSHFVRCEVKEVAPGKAASEHAGIKRESQRILEALRQGTLTVLLEGGGQELSSLDLAEAIRRWQNSGTKEVAIVVGGPNGFSREIAARANMRWSLSRLTFTHEMARVLVLEQIYRAYTIIRGLPYQK
jgi:23S rRNA (pseudouridine1915-N3)-methyltransferase